MNPANRLDYTRGTPKIPVSLEWKSAGPGDRIRSLQLKEGVHVRQMGLKSRAPRDPYPLVPSTKANVYPYTGVLPAKPAEMRIASDHFNMLDHVVRATLTDTEPTPDFDEHAAANFSIRGVDAPLRKKKLEAISCTGQGPEKCAFCLAAETTKDAMARVGSTN